MAGIQEIISGVLDREGAKYTNDPNDPGGPTKYGITQQAYEAYLGSPVTPEMIAAITPEEARQVYTARYVTKPKFDKVVALSEVIGEELVDSGVNCGVGTASIWLQRCLNVLNRNGKDYQDVVVDGNCGLATQTALQAYLVKRGKEGEKVMWRYLNALQGAYYITIAEHNTKLEDYEYGWGLNRLGGHV